MWSQGENGLIRLSHTLSNDCTDTQFHQRLALPRKISNYSNQKKLWFRGLGSRLSRIASLQNINGSCRHTSITSSSHVFKLAAVPAAEHANPVFLALLVTAQTLVWYVMLTAQTAHNLWLGIAQMFISDSDLLTRLGDVGSHFQNLTGPG